MRRIISFMLALLTPMLVSGQDKLVLFSFKKTPPIIDGNLTDECWKGAQVATGFMPLGKAEKAGADTEAMSCYDEKKIYFAVKLQEPQIANLKVAPKAPYSGDCVELFLDPPGTGRSFFHIIADSEANLYTGFNDGVEKPVSLAIEAKARRFDSYWALELEIPFAELNCSIPKDNQRWAFNVGRERYAVAPSENSSWAALGSFFQRDKFGKLAFYSRSEVVADARYWEKSDRDPLMRRATVSGCDIARESVGVKKQPDLGHYDPFNAEREKHKRWKCSGLSNAAKENHPEFYRAAMGINRGLIEKTRADEKISQFRKVAFYYRELFAAKSFKAGADPTAIVKESAAIDDELNAIYQMYGRAFDDNWNKAKLVGLDERSAAALAKIKALDAQANDGIAALRREAQAISPWKSESLVLPSEDQRLNRDGASNRLSFTAYGFNTDQEVYALLGKFDSMSLSWPYVIPTMKAPGKYSYEGLDELFRQMEAKRGITKAHFQTTFGLAAYCVALPPWLAEKAKTDPDLFIRSQDGLSPGERMMEWGDRVYIYPGGNPNNPDLLEFTHDYLKSLAAHAAAQDKTHFFLTTWESQNYIATANGKQRSTGYNPSGKVAFRDYLKERYGSVKELNQKWSAAYASFDAVEPPRDKFIQPPRQASGLTYEFERWSRVNHVRYMAKLRRWLKEGAPQVPVMTDDSSMLMEMNGYLAFKENTADVYSHHSNPSYEKALWTYLGTMSRKFGKTLGYYENYWQMHTSPHLKDERLAKCDVRKFFFDLYMCDIRLSCWWLHYMSHATDYVVAYGGGPFGMDYDQTIYRWSTPELATMFERGRSIEKALLQSRPEAPCAAIIQPCASIFNLAGMGRSHEDSPTIKTMFAAHYQLFAPLNVPHDYLPEEMALDGNVALDDYKLLILPYAPYMSEKFAELLKDWTARGGTLVAVGPFAMMNEFGAELPQKSSLFKTVFPKVKRTGQGDWDYSLDGNETEETELMPSVMKQPHGKGSVLYLSLPLDVFFRNPSLSGSLLKAIETPAKRTAVSSSPSLKILVRDGKRGEKYLCLCNQDVEKSLETTVTVTGCYATPLDVIAPDWFPVPSRIEAGETTVRVKLDPGEFTIILLQFIK